MYGHAMACPYGFGMPNPYGIAPRRSVRRWGNTQSCPCDSLERRKDTACHVRPGMPWHAPTTTHRPRRSGSGGGSGRGPDGTTNHQPATTNKQPTRNDQSISVESWSIRVIRVSVNWVAAEGASAPEPASGTSHFGLRISDFALRPIGLPPASPVSCPPIRRA